MLAKRPACTSKKRRSGRRRSLRDLGLKRPRTAFWIFLASRLEEFKKRRRLTHKTTVQAVSMHRVWRKCAGEEWQQLSVAEKATYVAAAKEERDRVCAHAQALIAQEKAQGQGSRVAARVATSVRLKHYMRFKDACSTMLVVEGSHGIADSGHAERDLPGGGSALQAGNQGGGGAPQASNEVVELPLFILSTRVNKDMQLSIRLKAVEALGQGSTGNVFSARDIVTNEMYSVKLGRKKDDDKDILAEARTLRAIHCSGAHRNICRFFGIASPVGLVLGLLSVTLHDWRKSQSEVPSDVVIDGVAMCLARALAYVHGQGIIHCDVKPANAGMQEVVVSMCIHVFCQSVPCFSVCNWVWRLQ